MTAVTILRVSNGWILENQGKAVVETGNRATVHLMQADGGRLEIYAVFYPPDEIGDKPEGTLPS